MRMILFILITKLIIWSMQVSISDIAPLKHYKIIYDKFLS